MGEFLILITLLEKKKRKYKVKDDLTKLKF